MKHGSIITPRPKGLQEFHTRAKALAPKPVNWFKLPPDGDLIGNDDYGDCDPVADFRLIQMWGGKCNKELALNRYSQLTGFEASKPETDQGTDTNEDMRSWCAFPIFDGEKAWPIYWAQVDPTDGNQVLRALNRVPLLATLALPKAIEDTPERWAYPPGRGPEWEFAAAHRVVLGAWDPLAWTVYTWGRYVKIHPETMRLMLSGGIIDVAIPHLQSAPDYLDLEGIDYDALAQDLKSLGIQSV